ncbi:ABC transporter ATP-binding protein [Bacillus haynesii]|uniref:ABC transporter ATP-binding protein n=1 Tax=Bacillus haynesii TaxID=1925021 RepID=UPI0022829B56|nr:ABC transporter ATP-binding protein [Bacillus haynesii]MCY7911767.1 ABC transporter ATP-binding protein [Bacillus haynesii]MCY7927494.1 ABC transporter ATP-binding protein [Bacillus haynesii]MCY8770837.1 ABC transporter ATP-binding protein [Bacillus haynesii]MEC0788307.1 ABC transporter ATP-binding protein [Bacillus haynesii]MEC1653612.1 ABC transporter ATP-binding protein [Bacillus haynesii]
MSNVVSLTNVTKTFRQKTAVDQIDFSIKKGEIVAILGPNGAGKTTTISMILGLLKPTAGNITLFDSMPHEKRVREKIGTMLQEVSVMPGLRAGEIIELVRSYYPKPLSFQKLRALTGLTDKDLKTQAEKLSGGQKRRLGFALALAGDPDLMIFDEPTVGMDITSRNRFWQTVQTLAEQGKTIIFSTHYLQEADDAAQRILLFKDGRIVADGTPLQIKSRISKHSVSFMADPETSLEKLYQHPEIEQISRKNNRIYIDTTNTDKILELLFTEKIGAYDIQIERGNLEEAFRQLTSKGDDVK